MRDAAPNFANRTLYHGDNLEFLRGINSGTVQLIATDPPFKKNGIFMPRRTRWREERVLPTAGAGRRCPRRMGGPHPQQLAGRVGGD